MAGPPTVWRRARGLVQASHPYPVAMVVLLTGILGVLSANGAPAWRLALALAAMLCSQLAIGWSNDYIDREHDARSQPQKPVPAGIVHAGVLPPLTLAALAVSLAAASPLGARALALLVLGTACGLFYNLAFKDTRLSWVPYLAAFALLPLFVWVSLDRFRDEFLWLYPVGLPLVLAVHVGNTLPDVATDRAAGRGGLVVSLGRERALGLLAACLMASPLLTLATLAWVDYRAGVLAVTLVAYGALALGGVAALVRAEARGAGFRLTALAAVVLVGGWLAAL